MGILDLITQKKRPPLTVQKPAAGILQAVQGFTPPTTPQAPGWATQAQNPGGDYQVHPQQPYDQQQPNQLGVAAWNLQQLSSPPKYSSTGPIPANDPYTQMMKQMSDFGNLQTKQERQHALGLDTWQQRWTAPPAQITRKGR